MQIHVQLAVAVRCSISGRNLSDSGLRAAVDGKQVRLIRKKDGFVLFTDLKTGEQEIVFSYPGYNESRLRVVIDQEKCGLDVVTMRPRFVDPTGALRLKVGRLEPGSVCYLAIQQMPFSLQEETEAGAREMKMYRKSSAGLLIPNKLLCSDPDAPEILILKDRIAEDTWLFEEPAKYPHKRGTKFYPVQPYEADVNGEIRSLIFAEGNVSVYYGNKLYELSLKEDTVWQIP